MNFFWTSYSYDSSALLGLQPADYAYVAVIAIVGMAIYFMLPILRAALDRQAKLKTKNEKKKVIEELIMMKEIQGEIEQEMREALIHEELRSKKEMEPAK